MLIRLLGSQVRIYVSYFLCFSFCPSSALRGLNLVGYMSPTLHYEPTLLPIEIVTTLLGQWRD